MSTYPTLWTYCFHILQWHPFLVFFLKEFRFSTDLLTRVLTKSVCNLTLKFEFLFSKILHIILLERLFFTLKSSIANDKRVDLFLVILQRRKYCLWTLSSKVFYEYICFRVGRSSIKHPRYWVKSKLWFHKCF